MGILDLAAHALPCCGVERDLCIATVGCGGHYIADVLVGILVAVCSIILAVRGSDLGYIFLDRAARLFAKLHWEAVERQRPHELSGAAAGEAALRRKTM